LDKCVKEPEKQKEGIHRDGEGGAGDHLDKCGKEPEMQEEVPLGGEGNLGNHSNCGR